MICMDYNATINYEQTGYSIYFECPVCSKFQKLRLVDQVNAIVPSIQKERFAKEKSYICKNCRSELALDDLKDYSTARRSIWNIKCIKRYSLLNWLIDGFE